MSATVKIRKSRLLNLKLVSFLYLIFIVSFFFSTSGNYIKFFERFSNTQNELNIRLKEKIKAVEVKDKNKLKILTAAYQTIEQLNSLNTLLQAYFIKKNISGERLKDAKFSSMVLQRKEKLDSLETALLNFVNYFPEPTKEKLLYEFGLKTEGKEGIRKLKNTFFNKAPNGFIATIFKHYETVILYNTLDFLTVEDQSINVTVMNQKNDSTFIKSLKKVYYLYEVATFDFYTRDSSSPNIDINGINYAPIEMDKSHYVLKWKAIKEGNYKLTASVKGQKIQLDFIVKNPDMRFFEDENKLNCNIGETTELSPDVSSFSNIPDLNFYSSEAKIEFRNNILKVTPLNEGLFTLEMRSGSKVLSQRQLFAKKGKLPEVSLKDVAGNFSDIQKAHCIESKSPYWQVINFNMIVVFPDGSIENHKSNTRFLRNELREVEAKAPAGSTIIFDKIRLLNSNGVTTAIGSPLFISK